MLQGSRLRNNQLESGLEGFDFVFKQFLPACHAVDLGHRVALACHNTSLHFLKGEGMPPGQDND